jgi:hypothetical protein
VQGAGGLPLGPPGGSRPPLWCWRTIARIRPARAAGRGVAMDCLGAWPTIPMAWAGARGDVSRCRWTRRRRRQPRGSGTHLGHTTWWNGQPQPAVTDHPTAPHTSGRFDRHYQPSSSTGGGAGSHQAQGSHGAGSDWRRTTGQQPVSLLERAVMAAKELAGRKDDAVFEPIPAASALITKSMSRQSTIPREPEHHPP